MYINGIGHPVSSPNLDQWQILIIDDDDAVCLGMTTLLAQWRAQVISAASIDELLKKTGKLHRAPNLLIADYRLAQGLTAQDVIHQLKSQFREQIPECITV